MQPWCTPFPVWSQSIVPCPVLTVASWPAYRFFRRLVRLSGIPISLEIFQFVVIHTVKDSSIVTGAYVDVFSGILLLFLLSSWCWQLESGKVSFSRKMSFVMQNTLGISYNSYCNNCPLSLFAVTMKRFFLYFHQENLVSFLEVNLTKLWGSLKIEAPQRVHAAMKFKTKTTTKCLLLSRKAMTNLDTILKSRDITLPKRSI